MNIAFLYEHPSWSDELIHTFDSRGLSPQKVNMADLSFNPDVNSRPFDFAINRINIMPSAERDPRIVFQTLHYLSWLEVAGVRVINGARAHYIGSSKAMQNGVFSALGLNHPAAIAIHRMEDALEAANVIGFPVIIKPNIGGSGSGIARFDDSVTLNDAIRTRQLDLGIDHSGLVQKFIQSDGYVYRIEILGDRLFYSIRQAIKSDSFNYCAADGCSTDTNTLDEDFDFCAINAGDQIKVFEAPSTIVSDVIKIVRHCGADVGGVEYMLEAESGKPCFYDFNPYSNFVTNGKSLLGFSPENRYVDFVLDVINAPS